MKNERTKTCFMIISCFGLGLLIAAGYIYFWIKDGAADFDIFDKILFVLFEALMIFFGVYGLIQYKKENLPPGEKELIEKNNQNRKLEKRKILKQKLVKKHKDMFSEFFWFVVEYNFWIMGFLYVLCMLLCVCAWKNYSDMPIMLLYIFWGVITACFIGYWIYLLLGGPVKKFKKMLQQTGYSIDEVNKDYMKGTAYAAMKGIINIGFLYTVYISSDGSFVIPNNQIALAEKRLEEQNINGNSVKHYYVRIYTEVYWKAFITDDAGADLVLEEFERHGIATQKID